MNEIKITISGLGGRSETTVREGATVAELRSTGLIAEGVTVRKDGQDVPDSEQVIEGGSYVITPPAAKHG